VDNLGRVDEGVSDDTTAAQGQPGHSDSVDLGDQDISLQGLLRVDRYEALQHGHVVGVGEADPHLLSDEVRPVPVIAR
jgi:hypothetical protein